jgi:hypothetical protein
MEMNSNSALGTPQRNKRRPLTKIYSFFNRQLAQTEITPTRSKQTIVPNCNRQLFWLFFFAQISPLHKMESCS